MELTEKLKEQLKKHALEDAAKECCGLLVENKKIQYIPLINKSKNEEESFAIDYGQLQEVEKLGQIVGFFHSHLEESFSGVDKLVAEKRKLTSIIYKIKEDEFEVYEPVGLEIPYTGRYYVMGIFDCFTLIQDYYERELNIKISDINHKDRFNLNPEESDQNQWENNFVINHLTENAFTKVQIPKKHDIILSRVPSLRIATHYSIYLGEGKILQQLVDEQSSIEDYNRIHKKLTVGIFRHWSNL